MKLVLAGYFGYGNLGDEALLAAEVAALRQAAPGAELVVLTADPEGTRAALGVAAADRRRPGEVLRALWRADLLVLGGGSLFQDATSGRNVLYYAGLSATARALDVPVFWYGQGIGPLRRRWCRALVRREAEGARGIAVRDAGSERLLREIGVRRPLEVTADPVYGLALPAGRPGACPDGDLRRERPPAIGLVLRPLPGEFRGFTAGAASQTAALLAEALNQTVAELGRRLSGQQPGLVVFPFHPSFDAPFLAEVARQMRLGEVRGPGWAGGLSWGPVAGGGGEEGESPREGSAGLLGSVLTALRQVDLVVSMRLHGLVLAAMAGVPAVALSIDPKIEETAAQLGLPTVPVTAELARVLPAAVAAAWESRGELARQVRAQAASMAGQALRNAELALEAAQRGRRRIHATVAGIEAAAQAEPANAAGPPDGPERVCILGIGVHKLTMDEAVGMISGWLEEPGGRVRQVVTANVELVMRSVDRPDSGLAALLGRADLVVADGIGLVWASRIQGTPLPQRIAGIELTEVLLERAAAQGWPLFLLGGQPGVASAASDRLAARLPGLRVLGTHHGYFALGSAEEATLLERLRSLQPRLLLVGMGAPLQERWIDERRHRLPPLVAIGVGGSLDVFAGRARRAPRLLRELGLEWAYRLWREPRRYRRILALPRFAAAVLAVQAAKALRLRGRAPRDYNC